MTTIITRLYEELGTAQAVAGELAAAGFPADTYDIITQTGQGSVEDQIMAARVNERAANAYAQHMSAGRALLVVRAPFNPMGAALQAMNIVDTHASVNAGVSNENRYVRERAEPQRFLKIWRGSPRFLTPDWNPGAKRRGLISRAFGMPLLKRGRVTHSAFKGGKFMSRGFWPMPLVVRREPNVDGVRGGTTVFSNLLGWSTIATRS